MSLKFLLFHILLSILVYSVHSDPEAEEPCTTFHFYRSLTVDQRIDIYDVCVQSLANVGEISLLPSYVIRLIQNGHISLRDFCLAFIFHFHGDPNPAVRDYESESTESGDEDQVIIYDLRAPPSSPASTANCSQIRQVSCKRRCSYNQNECECCLDQSLPPCPDIWHYEFRHRNQSKEEVLIASLTRDEICQSMATLEGITHIEL